MSARVRMPASFPDKFAWTLFVQIVKPAAKQWPIGNNGAPALLGDCAYVGRWHDYTGAHGIQVIEAHVPLDQPVFISVTGCPNSCAQYQIADIGLQGTLYTHQGEKGVEHYHVLVGGRMGEHPEFGRFISKEGDKKIKVPASLVPTRPRPSSLRSITSVFSRTVIKRRVVSPFSPPSKSNWYPGFRRK